MSKLKPCPFCGSDNLYVDGYDHAAGQRWRVVCLSCMAMVDPGTEQQKHRAIEAWNLRAQPENEPLTLEELRLMDGEPVWVMHADGSGSRWGIVKITEFGICAVVDDDTAYWFDDVCRSLVYRRKPERSEGE